jgi:diguanylate cyclase (GGDEF)-like protein
MSPGTGVAATHLLAEFLTLLARCPDEESATQAAIDHAATALEAEVCAVLRPDRVVSIGFPGGRAAVDELRAVVARKDSSTELPVLGACHVCTGELEGAHPGQLLLARAEFPFLVEEVNLVRAMARALSLTVEMMHTIAAERNLREHSERQAEENARLLRELQERQRLVESLSAIESAISRRAPLEEILDTITAMARQLLGSDAASLRIVDTDHPADLILVSSAGLDDAEREPRWRAPRGEVAVTEAATRTPEAEVPARMVAAAAAPVREDGKIIGSLLVASADVERPYTPGDRKVLQAFAEHVSLALTDAKTVQAMKHALRDTLTGLPNRALFRDRLEHRLAAAVRDGATVGLLFIDLDRFKPVNDTLGHAAGDSVLIEVAHRLRACLRAGDSAARFGGDEFAALLLGVDLEGALAVADRIAEAVRQPIHLAGKQVHVHASIGIAVSTGTEDATEMLRNADVAMYRAKRRGEGQREVFEPAMHAELLSALKLETDLHEVLEREELAVRYEPILALDTGAVHGFEAFVVWQHAELGILECEGFMPLADQNGMTHPIGRWLLRRVVDQMRKWHRSSFTPLTVHVNVSGQQIRHAEFVEDVRHALAAGEMSPQHLVLEITDVHLHRELESTIDTMATLRELGVRIAIDNFDTGRLSFSDLQRLPADLVKIDSSNLMELARATDYTALVSTVARLGRLFSLETYAEGITSADQVAPLLAAGCRYGQGSQLAARMDAAATEAFLRDRVTSPG